MKRSAAGKRLAHIARRTPCLGKGAMMKKGYTHLYTGNGKGKTTAAMGLALRARGAGLSVLFIQFLKKGDYSETASLAELGVTVEQCGQGGFFRPQSGDYIEHRGCAKRGYTRALAAAKNGDFDLIVCDEIICALASGLVTWEELQELIASKASSVELVLTGRDAPTALYDSCDLVTEMNGIKHYFDEGVKARPGIEL